MKTIWAVYNFGLDSPFDFAFFTDRESAVEYTKNEYVAMYPYYIQEIEFGKEINFDGYSDGAEEIK